MSKAKIIIKKGEIIDYQTMIEEIIGPYLTETMNYDANYDCKNIIAGKKVLDKNRAYIIGDDDYEIIIRKKKK